MSNSNVSALKAKLAGKINVVVTKNFSAEGKHKGAITYKQKDGNYRFCLQSSQLVKTNSGIYDDVRTGFAALPATVYDLLKDDLADAGVNWNEIMEALDYKPVAVYFQKSLTAFYKGQEPVKYTNDNGKTWINAKDEHGREYFRSPVVRDLGTYADCWGTVVEDSDGNQRFVRNDNSQVEEVAPQEEIQAAEQVANDPEEVA